MSQIVPSEPFHWHNPDGSHRMTDPRSRESIPERWWDSDERAYVTHLQTHEAERTDPQRSAEDPAHIRSLFDLLEARTEECRMIRELISAHREAAEVRDKL